MKNRVFRQPFLGHSARWHAERHARINAGRDKLSVSLYSSKAWQVLRRQVLEENGYRCQWPGCAARAHAVDHIEPHDNDNGRFFDRNNLQTLCAVHHSRKTAKYDGGFGHKRQDPKQ